MTSGKAARFNAANAAMARRNNAKYGRGRPKGRTVYKSKTTIPTIRTRNVNSTPKRVAKPTTQTPRQKAIAAARARGQAKIAAVRKRFNSLTPAQKIAMKQRQQAKALATKQRQATQKATPTKITGTLGKPSKAAIAARRNAGLKTQIDQFNKKQQTAIRRKAGAQAKARAGFRGRPTGRTVYKSKTTMPTRSTATSGKRSRDYSLGRRRFT